MYICQKFNYNFYVIETLTRKFSKVCKNVHWYIFFNNRHMVYPYSVARKNTCGTIMELYQNNMIKEIFNFMYIIMYIIQNTYKKYVVWQKIYENIWLFTCTEFIGLCVDEIKEHIGFICNRWSCLLTLCHALHSFLQTKM